MARPHSSIQTVRLVIHWVMVCCLAFARSYAEDGIEQSVRLSPVVEMAKPTAGLLNWSTEIGDSAGPVQVGRSLVFVGTNASRSRGPDQGLMEVLNLADGTRVGNVEHHRLPHRENDLPGQAIRSRAVVTDDGHAYYVSNRGELVSLNISDTKDLKSRWQFDMIGELGVHKRDASDIGNPVCSPAVFEDSIFSMTGHSRAIGPSGLPSLTREAPSMVALHRISGKVEWTGTIPTENVLIGQWGSPLVTSTMGQTTVIFPGGDGSLYGFAAKTGKLLWSIDCNSDNRTPWTSTARGSRCFFDSKPIVMNGILYIGMSQGTEGAPTVAPPVVAVDLHSLSGADQPAVLWRYEDPKLGAVCGELSAASPHIWGVTQTGALIMLDGSTGQQIARFKFGTSGALFSSPVILEKHILVNSDEELLVLSRETPLRCLFRYRFLETLENSPHVSGSKVLVTTRGHVWCLDLKSLLTGPLAPESPLAAIER